MLIPPLENKEYINGAVIKPNRNNKLSNLFSFSVNALLAIPLIPTKRPFSKKNTATASPIINPPVKAGIGVKFTMFIKLITQNWKSLSYF